MDERRTCSDVFVLHVPAQGPLLFGKAGLPFQKHFPFAVCLAANWVMTENEPHREHLASLESGVVSAGRFELDAGRFLPAANLDAIVRGRFRVEGERAADIPASPATVVN